MKSAIDAAGETVDLKVIADSINATKDGTVSYMPATWVPKGNQDGGLAVAAAKLEKGKVSNAIKPNSGAGYFYVRLIDSSDSQVQYETIQVPLSEFKTKLENLVKDNKLNKFVKIEDITN